MAPHKAGATTVGAKEGDAAWWIIVEDTGPGLPARAKEHLFTPFQGGMSKGGSGLGLAISAELVRGHGGSLELKKTGAGCTRFEICLPKGDGAL